MGELVVETRAPDERLGRQERRLLVDLARQAAPTAYAARLTRQLQRLNNQFEEEREEELRRIAGDLHDGIGPSLAGVRMQVKAARRLIGDGNLRVRQQLDSAVDDLNEVSSAVRSMVRNISLGDLQLGLLDAVRRQAGRFTGPDFEVCVVPDGSFERLPASVELAAYRIVGEALTNAIKHANARSSRILLSRTNDLRISITDDGAGIPVDAVPGIGIMSMRRRCEDLGGTLAISSQPSGTQIVAQIPLGGD